MSKIKVRANDKLSDSFIEGTVSKIGLMPFSQECHLIFLDDDGFACAKIGGSYTELRRLAEEIIKGIDFITTTGQSGVMQ